MTAKVGTKSPHFEEYNSLVKDILAGSFITGLVIATIVLVVINNDLANHGVLLKDRMVAGGLAGMTAGATVAICTAGIAIAILNYRMDKAEHAKQQQIVQKRLDPQDPGINS